MTKSKNVRHYTFGFRSPSKNGKNKNPTQRWGGKNTRPTNETECSREASYFNSLIDSSRVILPVDCGIWNGVGGVPSAV